MFPKEFLYNSIRFKLVGVHPNTGIAFYVNNGAGGVQGIRMYPDGRKMLISASRNLDTRRDRERQQGYLKFTNAFGHHKLIYASHAVYRAWYGHDIPAGMTIDHINGKTSDNRFQNLRCISPEQNIRCRGFLAKLHNKGVDPVKIERYILLRYYDRMAMVKADVTRWRYSHLTAKDLAVVLYGSDANFQNLLFSLRQRMRLTSKTSQDYAKRYRKAA